MITGKVFATRCPCLHPGDIQLFNCIDREELRNLYTNVVVFSKKGKRPSCNKLSCGDLDGDLYFICWNKLVLDQMKSDQIMEPCPLQFEQEHDLYEPVELPQSIE